MNKKEFAEIKKNFNDESELFTLNRVSLTFVDAEGNISKQGSKPYYQIPDEQACVFFEVLSSLFKGTIGKNHNAYEFPSEAYEDEGIQHILYDVVTTKMGDKQAEDKLIDRITSNLACDTAYALIMGHCTYSIPTKNKNDDTDTDNTMDEYNFITCAICPAQTGESQLVYSSDKGDFEKRESTELIVSRKPTDGFFFPVFNDRTPDVNEVMHYTKNPKKANTSLISDVLGFTPVPTPEESKEVFRDLITSVALEELDYAKLSYINDKLIEIVNLAKNDTKQPTLSETDLYNILSDAGVSDEKLETLKPAYEEVFGDGKPLLICNLVDNKTTLKLDNSITVNLTSDASDKLHTVIKDGRKLIQLEIEENTINVNGVDTAFGATYKQVEEESEESEDTEDTVEC